MMQVLVMSDWPTDNRIDVIGQNGNTGEHYGMKTYKIACMVTHSGKHLETEVSAYDMLTALGLFDCEFLRKHGLCMEALCELDISEVV
jgi:hypothetical protein